MRNLAESLPSIPLGFLASSESSDLATNELIAGVSEHEPPAGGGPSGL